MANIKTQIVLRNDSLSNWLSANPTLAKGEIGLAQLSGELSSKYELRIGDGVNDWNSLSATNIILPAENVVGLTETIAQLSTSYYETEGNVADLTGNFVNGDIAVEKRTINGALAEFTAYRYDSNLTGDNKWRALDKNYNAANVYFDENLTYTTGLGVIAAPTGGSGELATAGKSVEDLFKQILAQESLSVTCDRVVNVSFAASTSTGKKEVGDTVAYSDLKYTFTVSDVGSWNATYQGKTADGTKTADTGVRVDAKILTLDGSELTSKTSMNKSGTLVYTPGATEFPSLVATDDTLTCKLSASYTYTASNSKPLTNLGNFILSGTVADASIKNITKTGSSYEDGLGAIAAKTTATSLTATASFRGYRKMHIVTISSDFDALTEDLIVNSPGIHVAAGTGTYDLRASNSTDASKKTIKLINGTKAIVLAFPTTGYSAGRDKGQILLESASNTPITDDYKSQSNIDISGKVSGQHKAAYKVYMYKPDGIATTEVHKITIK